MPYLRCYTNWITLNVFITCICYTSVTPWNKYKMCVYAEQTMCNKLIHERWKRSDIYMPVTPKLFFIRVIVIPSAFTCISCENGKPAPVKYFKPNESVICMFKLQVWMIGLFLARRQNALSDKAKLVYTLDTIISVCHIIKLTFHFLCVTLSYCFISFFMITVDMKSARGYYKNSYPSILFSYSHLPWHIIWP